MRTLAIVVVALLLMGCESEKRSYSDNRDAKNAILGIVGRHPEDPEAQVAAIEESDFFDSALDAGAGQLIREGILISTEKGLKVVPREEWPEGLAETPK